MLYLSFSTNDVQQYVLYHIISTINSVISKLSLFDITKHYCSTLPRLKCIQLRFSRSAQNV